MDNNKNKQFYWEVKDFLNRKQPIAQTKPSSLKNTINNIMESKFNTSEVNYEESKNSIVNSSTDAKIGAIRLLNSFDYNMHKQKPNSNTSSKNIITNLFNIK